MFYNLKIALRSLKASRLYSIINIAGLAISMAVCILILLWVQDEMSYEKYYKQADRIFLAIVNFENDGHDVYWAQGPTAISHIAREGIPEVETACAVNKNYDLGYLEYNGKKFFGDRYISADTTFFHIFENTFLEGSSNNALPDPYSVVITESMAKKIFGREPALGKALIGGNGGGKETKTYYVSGVVKDQPSNTHMQYGAVFSFKRSKYNNTWTPYMFPNYLLLKPGTDKDLVAKKLCELHNKNTPDISGVKSYQLQSLQDIHLYAPDGSETVMSSVRLFVIIAFVILSIACINYVNMVTARANKRNKEISVRKILGAPNGKLFIQLINEAVILFFISLIIALIIAFLLIPFYNQITGKNLSLPFMNPVFWSISGIMFFIVIILAGIYPAVKLASFRSIDIFNKKISVDKTGFSLRKMLVVFQFIAAIVLITSTIVLNRQLAYIQHKNLGYDKEQVFSTWMFTNLSMRNNYENFKSDLEKEPEIAGISGSSANIMNVQAQSGVTWEGMQDGRDFSIATEGIDRNFFAFMNIPLVEGSGFTGTPADSSRYYLNETAVKEMGIKDPIGKTIELPWLNKGVIAGVIKDFHFSKMDQPIGPMIMYLQETPWTIYIKAAKGKIPEAISVTQKIWKKYDPDFPFNYQFMDDTFNEMYSADQMRGTLFNYFSIVAILISCLGLFGLVTYTAEAKVKEIGIRKVLGASVNNIVNMLSKEFLILVGIAMLVAFPLAYYWLNKMLQDYAYHISIEWWMFVLAGLVTVILTLFTVGWQSIKAATANPVDSIKTE